MHGGDLTIARLPRIRLAHHLVFFREPGIENPAEIHVAGMAAGPNDHTSSRANVQRVALIGGGNSENSSRKLLLSDDSRHAVLQKYLHAQFSGAGFQRPHEGGAVSSVRSHGTRAGGPNDGLRSFDRLRAAISAYRGPIRKLHSVSFEPFKSRSAHVTVGAENFTVAEAVIVPRYKIGEHPVRRIFDPVLLLQTRAASEGDVSAALDGVTADIVILLDDDYGCSVLGGFNGRRKASGSGADDDDIRDLVPMPGRVRRVEGVCGRADKGSSNAHGGFPDKGSPREGFPGSFVLGHDALPRFGRSLHERHTPELAVTWSRILALVTPQLNAT